MIKRLMQLVALITGFQCLEWRENSNHIGSIWKRLKIYIFTLSIEEEEREAGIGKEKPRVYTDTESDNGRHKNEKEV